MLSPNLVIFTAFAYVGLLFLLAYVADQRSRRGRGGLFKSPFVYTLSISVYCTSWTFYGAVGSAARNGLEFLAIYLGPTLVFVGWWYILRKLVRIGRAQRITSVADLLSSRFGKSGRLAVLITIIAVVGTTPYIALQLKAITTSIRVITAVPGATGGGGVDDLGMALAVAAGMALFTVLFGTRNVDANEQHHGVVAAIAFEAVIKLAALLAVGFFVVFGLGGGFEAIFTKAAAAGIEIYDKDTFGPRWIAMLVLSGAAILCLPRQFQITVVENADEDHLRTAGWAFPAYLLLMSLFTMPIALYGLTALPADANPDMFVLTLPLAAGQNGLAMFAFIGGFSSATSMIIVATIALSIMVSNHIVLPLALRSGLVPGSGNGSGMSRLLLTSRRVSIGAILFLGFVYFWLTGDSDALAPIGLISFTGVAQFLPAMLAALYWREATKAGAIFATLVGFVVWGWTSFLPSFASSSTFVAELVALGPFGLELLRPQALFGLQELDPMVHSVFWSLFLNSVTLISVSLFTRQSTLERIQSTLFVDAFRRRDIDHPNFIGGSVTSNDLFFVVERVLGAERAHDLFTSFSGSKGAAWSNMEPTPAFIGQLERELAGAIGAASAHVMLSTVVSGSEVSLEEVMAIAGETRQAIAYSQELEQKSEELRLTAQKLQKANERLRELDSQKDDFLSQVSHDVRTPMTSIRSFSEILLDPVDVGPAQRQRFLKTIHLESVRLTRLLDDILDLGTLERGERGWDNIAIDAEPILDQALAVCEPLSAQKGVSLTFEVRAKAVIVSSEPDRLAQVFINLITNAINYNDATNPIVRVTSRRQGQHYIVEVIDNGSGVARDEADRIFEKFARGRRGPDHDAAGSGLGLAISRQIIEKMDGRLELAQGDGDGACFRISLPVVTPQETLAPGPEILVSQQEGNV